MELRNPFREGTCIQLIFQRDCKGDTKIFSICVYDINYLEFFQAEYNFREVIPELRMDSMEKRIKRNQEK